MKPVDSATVSLYIPCRNAADHVCRTLESVFVQTYPILEVIVVDDGSEDDTVKVAHRFPVDLIRHPKPMGITATRNTAIRKARGDIVASVDADVVLENRWLERVVSRFADPQTGGVGGRIIEGNTDPIVGRWILVHRNPDRGEEGMEDAPCLAGGAVAYRRRVLLEVGGYNDDRRYDHSDLDLSLRVKMVGYRLAYEPRAVCRHYFQGGVGSLFDGVWRFKKDAYVNCGLFTHYLGLRRKIEINLGEFYQLLMDDLAAGNDVLLPLSIVGALRHSFLDISLYYQLHRQEGAEDTLGALRLGLRYLLEQKREISFSLMRDILRHALDTNPDSGDQAIGAAEGLGERDLSSRMKENFPQAHLETVSDGLTMVLGFLNSIPREAWEVMNRLSR